MSEIYKEKILDHYNHPRNWKELQKFTHHGKAENMSCGDSIEVWIDVDDNDTISEIGYKGEGCVISLASGSIMTEEMKGKRVVDISSWSSDVIVDTLGISLQPARLKCALMILEAAHRALHIGDNNAE